MKAAERRRKRLQEKSKQSIHSSNNELPKKKLISVPSQKDDVKLINPEDFSEINSENKIQNIAASRPANNMDIEKISKRIKERKEKRKRKKMLESGINPDNNNNNNNNININANNTNIDNNNMNNNININNNINNNKNYISEKDSNKLVQSVESMAPLAGLKKVNFNIPSNKNFNINNQDNNINNNNNIIINNKSNSNSSMDSMIIKDIRSTTSKPNYQLLSKNFANIKNENIEEFLTKTNPNKPSNEEKESEVKRMIEVMNLKPNLKSDNNKTIKNDDNNYAYNLTQKIEDNNNYYENQKEIKELKERVIEEEKKLEQKLQRNKEEIQKYIEKIISWQNILINSKQGDIVALEEENKIDDIQINNYSVTYQRLVEENEKERNKMFYLINKEIIPLQKELKSEINEVRNLKIQLKQWNKKAPPKDILKKIEVVMKYMKHCS